MQLIRLNLDGTTELIPFNPKDSFSQIIECEYIEIVRPRNCKHSLIVDEEGRLKENKINILASYLYGTHFHYQPIMGTVLVCDITPYGEITGLTDDSAIEFKKKLDDIYLFAFNMIKNALE